MNATALVWQILFIKLYLLSICLKSQGQQNGHNNRGYVHIIV